MRPPRSKTASTIMEPSDSLTLPIKERAQTFSTPLTSVRDNGPTVKNLVKYIAATKNN